MKILVVDDSKAMRMIVKRNVSQIEPDAEFIEAENGAQALEVLATEQPVLVLCDWNMPEMNGIEFLRAIKDRPGLAKIPVIMLTTESERRKMIEAIEAGAKHYLTKPFQPETLATKILQCVETGA